MLKAGLCQSVLMPQTPLRAHSGVTLPELMVVMAVFAIAVTTIGPGLFGVMEDSRVASYSEILLKDLKLARHEAIIRGNRVIICSIQDKDTSSCANSKDWSQGWMIFSDADGTLKPTDAANDLIQVQDPLPKSVTITSGLGFGNTYQIYNPDGTSSFNGHFDITSSSDSSQAHARKIDWDRFRNPTLEVVNPSP